MKNIFDNKKIMGTLIIFVIGGMLINNHLKNKKIVNLEAQLTRQQLQINELEDDISLFVTNKELLDEIVQLLEEENLSDLIREENTYELNEDINNAYIKIKDSLRNLIENMKHIDVSKLFDE